jgi:hypothetical protein
VVCFAVICIAKLIGLWYQKSAPSLAAGYQLSVIWKQQEAASLIQEETGE